MSLFSWKKGELSCFRFRNNALLICYETVNANAYQILAKDPLELHCIDILTFSRFKHSENECNFSVSFMKCQNRISARARKTWQEKKADKPTLLSKAYFSCPQVTLDRFQKKQQCNFWGEKTTHHAKLQNSKPQKEGLFFRSLFL